MNASLAPAVGGLLSAAAALAASVSVRRVAEHRRSAALRSRLPGPADSPESSFAARVAAPAWFVGGVEGLGLATDATTIWWRVVGVGLVLPAVAYAMGGAPLALVVAAAAIAAGFAGIDLARHRATRLVDDALPALLDEISNGLRSGLSLTAALHEAAEHGPGPLMVDVRRCLAVAAGRGVGAGLVDWRERRPSTGVRLAVAALSLSAELGGACRPIEGVAASLRERGAIEREARALSAQARASAAVIIGAPLVFLVLLGLSDDGVLPFFTQTTLGFSCLAADGGGAWWMLRIVRAAS